MIAVIINTCTVITGSITGLLCRKGISEKYKSAIMTALGICTIFIGIQGSLKSENVLVTIISMVLGTAAGTFFDIDSKISSFGRWVEEKVTRKTKKKGDNTSIAQGMVTAYLLWCVGAMTIVGSIQAGVSGDYSTLITKSVLDLISSAMLASTLGAGVLLASGLLFLTQGSLVLLAGVIAPVLNDSMINEITCVGSLIIFALGLNIVKITDIKVANFLPAVILAPFICKLLSFLPF
ncbi:MAG: DUF554 domain-containing protein [Oscillospiraceae bacterium]|nr:DUF554 domain-containing protein [Oscillospiraceae bacterium]